MEAVAKSASFGIRAFRSAETVSPARSASFGQSVKLALRAKKSGCKGVVSMSKESAGSGYAAALVQLAKATNSLEAVHRDIEVLSSLLNSAELTSFLANPVIGEAQKKGVLTSLAKEYKFADSTANFLSLLVDKKRINILKVIAVEVDELYCEVTDTQVAVVTSAVKLENSQQALIAKKLQSMTGAKNIKLKNIVDPSLIAGFIVKYGKDGSCSIDMSVKGQLDRLAAQFETAEQLAAI